LPPPPPSPLPSSPPRVALDNMGEHILSPGERPAETGEEHSHDEEAGPRGPAAPTDVFVNTDAPPEAADHHLEKWDALHRLHAHAGWRRLRKLALAMLPDDPQRPSMRYLRQWRQSRRCTACLIGNAERPNLRLAHPPRALRDQALPGECLCIDSSGAYAMDHDNCDGAVLGNFTHSWILTDDASNVIITVPGKTATCAELLEHVKDYQAASGVRLKSLYTDLAFLCEPLESWARNNGVKLGACARDVHQANGRSENSVKTIKSLTRINNAQAGTPSARLQPYAHACAAQQHNRTPSSSGPSPLSLWPSAPWQHPSSPLHPWGCRVVGFVGKQSQNPNIAMRGRAGIFVGLDTKTSAYLIYHEATDTICSYGYITAVTPYTFPIKDLQWAGELAPPDGCLDPDAWRRHAARRLHDVDDGPAAEFLSGKQVCFDLPVSCYPDFTSSWRVRCVRPVYTQSGDKVVLVRCHFVAYNGGDDSLSPAQRADIGKFVDIPMSLPKGPTTQLPASALSGVTVRAALASTFPAFSTLAEFAQGSAVLQGPTLPNVLSTGFPPLRAPPPRANRIIFPVRSVGGARSAHATWTSPKHYVLPSRTRVVIRTPAAPSGKVFATFPSRSLPTQAIAVSSHGAVGFEPKSLQHARAHHTWPLWESAVHKEISGLEQRHTWDVVNESSVPRDVRILPTKLLFKDKRVTGAKCRLVVRGDLQHPKPPASETYSGTPSATEVRTLLSLATQRGWGVHSCDISQAFIQAHPLDPNTHIYVRPPPGLDVPPGTVWKLRRHLYGLCALPKAWTDTLRAFLTSYGFTSVNSSSTLYAWTDGVDHIQLCFHVDDLLICFSNDDKAQAFKSALLTRFEGLDDGPVQRYVGIDIIQTPAGQTFLSQAYLAQELLEELGMQDCNPAATPLPAASLLLNKDRSDPPDEHLRAQYAHIVGTLQYLATWTRPDLAFPVSQLSRHMSAPGPLHMSAAKHVLRYLRGTIELGILYSVGLPDSNRLISFADADFATCPDTRRSVGAYVVLLNGGAVSWKTKLQGVVATSTCEAEFVSASKASDELAWLRRTVFDLHAPQDGPTPLYEDNRSARMLSETSALKERSKHIDYRIFSLRDRVASGIVRLVDCPTFDMVADLLTKNLPSPSFRRHRDTLLGSSRHTAPVAA
jgi:Reverse transcriptase (RNA-dependent DNA polymerase)